MRLQRNEALLVIIDVQERFIPVIDRYDSVVANIDRLIRGLHVLDIPLLVTEQYVKGLGPTVASLQETLRATSGYRPIEKMCFSAAGAGEFQSELRRLKKKQILLAGIETHVCVYQTAIDLLAAGNEVTVLADAVSSRTAENREIAIRRLVGEGAKLASTEMVLFEMLVESGTDEFRAISKIVK
jgi:nicotinamidase-related amidase